MSWRFCMTRDKPELLTDIHDFSILRDFECLESSMQGDLGMWFAVYILSHSQFCFLLTLFLV